MNLSIYVFKRYRASVGNKVLSFPTDLDKTIEEVVDSIDIPYRQRIKLIVLRQGNLVHYLYVVKIDADLVGFVFTMNGAYLADVGSLCRACGDIIAAISFQSLIITWSGRNGLVFTTKNVSAYREEAEKVMARLEELRDNSVFSKAGALPPLDYSEAKQSKRLDWSCKSIIEPIPEEYRHIDRLEIILPTVNYSVSAVLAEANKKADTWKKHYSELSTRFNTLNRQKKRMKWVVILALCLVAGAIILLNVNKNLNQTQSSLTEANNRIKSLNENIDSLTTVAQTYMSDINSIIETSYDLANEQISKYPITIHYSDVSYKDHSGYEYHSTPSSNDNAAFIQLEVHYARNQAKTINKDRFPSVVRRLTEGNGYEKVAIDSLPFCKTIIPPEKIECKLHLCYRNREDDIYWDKGDVPFDVEINSSGSFVTPYVDYGYYTLPSGYYRIEIRNSKDNIVLGSKEFTIR